MLFCKESGKGAPLVLLHGFLSSHVYWERLLPELEKQYRVIRIDLLGFGKSPKPSKSEYSLESHSQEVIQTIQHILGKTTPFTLAGHSMGALIACKVASELPAERVSQLLLYNMPLFDSAEQARTTFKRARLVYRIGLYSRFRKVLWPFISLGLRLPTIRNLLHSRKSPRIHLANSTHTSRTRSLRNTIEATNGIELLNSVTTPTIFIYGTHDRLFCQQHLTSIKASDTLRTIQTSTGHHTLMASSSAGSLIALLDAIRS